MVQDASAGGVAALGGQGAGTEKRGGGGGRKRCSRVRGRRCDQQ